MTDLTFIDKTILADSIQTLNQVFTTMPVLRTGGVPINSPTLRLDDPTFCWKSGYVWEHAAAGKALPWPPGNTTPYPAWTSDTDADVVPNADMITQLGISPYSCTATDGLIITPIKTPTNVAPLIDATDAPGLYISGALTSFPYAQTYGIFSAVMKVPKGIGMWPAFWLLPQSKVWPPELDIMEVLGSDTTSLYTTLHTSSGTSALKSKQVDLSLDYHEYTADWGPTTINWYIDKKFVFSAPTPPGMHQPHYILANLAIGLKNSWAQAPALDASGNPILAPLYIKSIKAWQRLAYI